MLLKDANLLIENEYLPLETGWTRLDDGQAFIAVRTQMPGCLLHFVQDTPDGCVMRSRFWLGDVEGIDQPVTPALRREMAPDKLAVGLLKHCCKEMSLLGSFLPVVHELYNRPKEAGNRAACPNG